MKSFRYSMPDFIAVFFICCVVGITGYMVYNSKGNVSYSISKDSGVVDDGAASLDAEINENVTFVPDPNKVLKKSSYSLEEVYNSIRERNNNPAVTIDTELNNIYQHFYDYFASSNKFINMLGEEYTYDEYMYATTYSLVRTNTHMFGLYMITYSKCDIFSSLENHYRDNELEKYCEKYN